MMVLQGKDRIKGTITIDDCANIWSHEFHIAKALANAGYDIHFIPAHSSSRSADAYVNNTIFEFKSPEGSKIKSVERNIIKAINGQSPNVAITSFRMKKITDHSIRNYLVANYSRLRGAKQIFFITRDGRVIDINKLLG